MGTLDPETEGLEAVPENRLALAWLRSSAEAARSEYRMGPFELHTHPDVCERLDQLARGGRSVGAYGLCARVAGSGRLYAIGMGTGSIALRLPIGPVRATALSHGARLEPRLGPDWVVADAWLSSLSGTEGTTLLVAWVEAARSAADA